MSDALVEVQNIIGGEWREAAVGRMYEVNDSAHPREIIGRAALANQDDVRDAIEAAHCAFAAWAALSYAERAERLTAAAAPLAADEARLQDMIHLFTRKHGKIRKESAIEFSRFRDRFAWPVAQAARLAVDEKLSGPPFDTIATYQPRGVASQIVPWNWPISLLRVKAAPAFASGVTPGASPPRLRSTGFTSSAARSHPMTWLRQVRATLQVPGAGRACLPLLENRKPEGPSRPPLSGRSRPRPHPAVHAGLLRRVATARSVAIEDRFAFVRGE